MLFAGWWIAGYWERALAVKAAFIVWLAYAVIDLSIIVTAGISSGLATLLAVSFTTKLAAVLYGAKVRLARSGPSDA